MNLYNTNEIERITKKAPNKNIRENKTHYYYSKLTRPFIFIHHSYKASAGLKFTILRE